MRVGRCPTEFASITQASDRYTFAPRPFVTRHHIEKMLRSPRQRKADFTERVGLVDKSPITKANQRAPRDVITFRFGLDGGDHLLRRRQSKHLLFSPIVRMPHAPALRALREPRQFQLLRTSQFS